LVRFNEWQQRLSRESLETGRAKVWWDVISPEVDRNIPSFHW
jgi:hypothetical protein